MTLALERTKKSLIKKILTDSVVAQQVTENYLHLDSSSPSSDDWQIIETTTNQDLLHLHTLKDGGDYRHWGDVYNNKNLTAETLISISKSLFPAPSIYSGVYDFNEFVSIFHDHKCVNHKVIEKWFELLKGFDSENWAEFEPIAERLFEFKGFASAYLAALPAYFECFKKTSSTSFYIQDISLIHSTILEGVILHPSLLDDDRYSVIEQLFDFISKYPEILDEEEVHSVIYRLMRKKCYHPDLLLRLVPRLETFSGKNLNEMDDLLEAVLGKITRTKKKSQFSVEYVQPLLLSEDRRVRKVAKKLMESK